MSTELVMRVSMKMASHRRVSLLCALIASVTLSAGPLLAAGSTVSGARNLVAAANGGRVVAFSSQALDENDQPIKQWQAANLIDEKYVTGTHTPADSFGWRSVGVPTPEAPEFVVFAFANDQLRLINRVVCNPTTDDPEWLGRWAKDIRILVSTTEPDGPYRVVGTHVLVRKGIQQTFEIGPVEAKYVKLEITGNWGSDYCVELGEFEVYEAIVGDDALDQLIMRLTSLLEDLKRYRDSQRYQEIQETIETITNKPEASTEAPANE